MNGERRKPSLERRKQSKQSENILNSFEVYTKVRVRPRYSHLLFFPFLTRTIRIITSKVVFKKGRMQKYAPRRDDD